MLSTLSVWMCHKDAPVRQRTEEIQTTYGRDGWACRDRCRHRLCGIARSRHSCSQGSKCAATRWLQSGVRFRQTGSYSLRFAAFQVFGSVYLALFVNVIQSMSSSNIPHERTRTTLSASIPVLPYFEGARTCGNCCQGQSLSSENRHSHTSCLKCMPGIRREGSCLG